MLLPNVQILRLDSYCLCTIPVQFLQPTSVCPAGKEEWVKAFWQKVPLTSTFRNNGTLLSGSGFTSQLRVILKWVFIPSTPHSRNERALRCPPYFSVNGWEGRSNIFQSNIHDFWGSNSPALQGIIRPLVTLRGLNCLQARIKKLSLNPSHPYNLAAWPFRISLSVGRKKQQSTKCH